MLKDRFVVAGALVLTRRTMLVNQIIRVNLDFFTGLVLTILTVEIAAIRRDQVNLSSDWVNHLGKHFGAVFELEPEISPTIHNLLRFKVHGHVFHGNFIINFALLLF